MDKNDQIDITRILVVKIVNYMNKKWLFALIFITRRRKIYIPSDTPEWPYHQLHSFIHQMKLTVNSD